MVWILQVWWFEWVTGFTGSLQFVPMLARIVLSDAASLQTDMGVQIHRVCLCVCAHVCVLWGSYV